MRISDWSSDVCSSDLFARIFEGRGYLALTLRRRPGDQLRLHDLTNLAARHRVPTVVTGDVLYHHPHRRVLQEVMTCTRHRCTIDALGARRERHADRFLMPAADMHQLYHRYPAACARTCPTLDSRLLPPPDPKNNNPKQ